MLKKYIAAVFMVLGLCVAAPGLNETIPFDPSIVTGQLENGLTYFIKHNEKPANRAELRLAVSIGSVDEEEDQRGLAHFLEHMCFNGTERYPKNELVDYLESLGMGFGPDLNAYTAFDETVYMIQIPTDDPQKFRSGVEILSEWAGFLTLDHNEIDKERGVIMEEWRQRRGASARIFDEQFQVLVKDSKYAERIPIGLPEIVENCPYERLESFYRKWYRPDLMAVMMVGDFETDQALDMIMELFGRIPSPNQPQAPGFYEVPKHKEPRIIISSDPEASRATATITYKQDVQVSEVIGDYVNDLKESLYFDMFNQRLRERIRDEDQPFASAYSGKSKYVESVEFTMLYANASQNGISGGIHDILWEVRRVQQFGFLESELNRAKDRMYSQIEKAFNERDKTESRKLIRELVGHFLENEPVPGIEWEFSLASEMLGSIAVEDVNSLTDTHFPKHSMVIQISMPEEDEMEKPSEDDLTAMLAQMDTWQVQPYKDDISDQPLLNEIPEPGMVIGETWLRELDVYEWQLSNGATVVAKPTTFKNDQILFTSFAPGGGSMASETDYRSAVLSSAIVMESGMADFTLPQLEKMLSGKIVEVGPFIDDYYHGFRGSSTTKDLETALQILYGRWTSPRKDKSAFENLMARYKSFVENRVNSPEFQFNDLVFRTNYSDHYAMQNWSVDILEQVDFNTSLDFYQKAFSNPGNFTFVFVGAFDIDELREMVETYIGSLPVNSKAVTHARDMKIKFPRKRQNKILKMGVEPKSKTRITFYKPLKDDFDEMFVLNAVTEILEVRLRDILREEMGATYYVGSGSANMLPASKFATTYVAFDSNPENVDEMVSVVFEEISKMKKDLVEPHETGNIVEKYLKDRETKLESNYYWMNSIQSCLKHGVDPHDILKRDERIRSLTPEAVKKSVKKYYPKKKHTIISLYPEDWEG